MNIDACSLRNDEVVTTDGKKFGTVVNVFFEADSSPRAWLLIYPLEENWIVERVKKNWGDLAIEAIKLALPKDLPKIEAQIAAKGTEAAEKTWNAYIKDNFDKLEMKYKLAYFVPTKEIEGSKLAKNCVTLKCDWDIVSGSYQFIGAPRLQRGRDVIPIFESRNVAVRHAEKYLPVTLNHEPLCQDYEVCDSEDDDGVIEGMQLDLDNGKLAGIVVSTDGRNAGTYLATPENFDFANQQVTKPFSELPKFEG